jgi:hypothetical protein
VILDAIAPLIPCLRHVAIDEAQVDRVCARLTPDDLPLPTWDDDVFTLHPPERRAAQILLFNAINFSYWGDPKWTIDFRGRPLDGAWGMLGAIARAVDEGYPVFDAAYLATIPASDLRRILRGNVEIPMFQERLDILHETGAVLTSTAEFGGCFVGLIRAAANDAVALVQLLTTRFPSFDDTAVLNGRPVAFYKRAQLSAAMVYAALGGAGLGDLRRVEQLTVFADYKLPQALRRLGVLRYAPDLAERVGRCEPLAAGSREEVEIRAATVWVGELMRRALAARGLPVTALHVDYWLWRAGQQKGPETEPYHRTRTIFY